MVLSSPCPMTCLIRDALHMLEECVRAHLPSELWLKRGPETWKQAAQVVHNWGHKQKNWFPLPRQGGCIKHIFVSPTIFTNCWLRISWTHSYFLSACMLFPLPPTPPQAPLPPPALHCSASFFKDELKYHFFREPPWSASSHTKAEPVTNPLPAFHHRHHSCGFLLASSASSLSSLQWETLFVFTFLLRPQDLLGAGGVPITW